MIPTKAPILPGLDVTGPDGEVYRIKKIFGRGRNRQVRLDRPPNGQRWPEVRLVSFRIYYTVIGKEA